MYRVSFKQEDIKTTGRIFSTVVILLFNIIWPVIILCVVISNHTGILTYFKSSLARAADAYRALFEAARTRLLPASERLWATLPESSL